MELPCLARAIAQWLVQALVQTEALCRKFIRNDVTVTF